MKYVAFLDILGFKEKLKNVNQQEAIEFIGSFSHIAYSEFCKTTRHFINGFIVSDSIILHTDSDSRNELIELIKLVNSICKNEFTQNGILIRGAISKGEFEDIPASELPQLKKKLIVGQAYVDAYKMESSIKAIGIVLGKEVWEDLNNCDMVDNVVEESVSDKDNKQYIYKYLTVDFFMNENHLKEFIKQAVKSEWLPHYYNSIYLAIKNETSSKKVDAIFNNIIKELEHKYKWRSIDLFIKNSFAKEVFPNYQTRFLRFIRDKIYEEKPKKI